MARYCFYCGRELSIGERCHCNDPAWAGAAGASTSGTQPKGEPTGGGAYSYHTTQSRETAGAGGFTKTRHARRTTDGTTKRSVPGLWRRFAGFFRWQATRLQTAADQIRTNFPNITRSLISFTQYISRPASKIRQESMRVKRRFTIPFILIFSAFSGFFSYILIRNQTPFFSGLLSTVTGTEPSYFYEHQLTSFFVMTLLSVLFVLSLCLAFYVTAHFNNRKPTFRKILDVVSISVVYLFIMEFFMLLSHLTGGKGWFTLIVISFLLMVITHFLSFRSALGLSEDSAFYLVIFSYVICYFLFKLSIYLTTRALFLT